MKNKPTNTNKPKTVQPLTAPSKRQLRWPVLFLAFLSVVVYANTLMNGYAYDDKAAITTNPLVEQGIPALPKILVTPYHYGNYGVMGNATGKDDVYRPLSLMLFAVENQVFPGNPLPMHLINVLLFAACVLLLYVFISRLFGSEHPVLAWVAAALFALHPIHTEVVANIKSRDELLCFLFAISMLLAFLDYSERGKRAGLISGLVLFFLSLMAKETSITFLAVIPFVFFCYKNDQPRRSWAITLSALLPALAFVVIRTLVLRAHGAGLGAGVEFIDNALCQAPSASVRLATQIWVMGAYLKLLLLPYPLLCDYAFAAIPFKNFGDLFVWLTISVYLVLAWVAVARLFPGLRLPLSGNKKSDPLAFGILFFFITLSLFTNLFVLLGSEMSERFLFFPSVGFCVAIGWLAEVWLHRPGQTLYQSLTQKKALAALLPLALVLGLTTINRSNDWKDDATLFDTDCKKSPDNARLNTFAAAYGMETMKDQNLDIAGQTAVINLSMERLRKSIAIYPGYALAHRYLGIAYMVTRQHDSAYIECRKAVTLDSFDFISLNNLAIEEMSLRHYPEAISLERRAMVINPGNPFYPCNIAACDFNLKQFDSSIVYNRKAARLDPDNILFMKRLAASFNALNQIDSAHKYEHLVQQREPDFHL